MNRLLAAGCCAVLGILIIGKARAGEVLVRIAHVSDQVLTLPITTSGGFGTRQDFIADLAAALDAGVYNGDPAVLSRRHIPASAVLDPRLREARREIADLFPDRGRLVGRQAAAGQSAWHKCIIHFPQQDGSGHYLFEAGDGSGVISFVAVQNEAGILEQWQIGDCEPPPGGGKYACRIDRAAFMSQLVQNTGRAWLYQSVSRSNGVGILIVRNAPQDDSGTDTALIWIEQQGLARGSTSLPDAAIVIGWHSS